jgi:hypothetical protein
MPLHNTSSGNIIYDYTLAFTGPDTQHKLLKNNSFGIHTYHESEIWILNQNSSHKVQVIQMCLLQPL